jgi:hypothetical protein
MENTQCVIHIHSPACIDVRAVTFFRELEKPKSTYSAYFHHITRYGMWQCFNENQHTTTKYFISKRISPRQYQYSREIIIIMFLKGYSREVFR